MDIHIYHRGNLTFLVSDDKIIVRTSLGQQFYLSPKQHYWSRRLKLIKVMVSLNEIRTLDELASLTNPGIEWLHTSRNYTLDTAKERAYT